LKGKIVSINDLEVIADNCKKENKRIVHTHGVFDLLHIGHINHFQHAKKFGDVLFVTVTPDRYVNRGPHRPIFNEQLRAEAIAAIDVVDYVVVLQNPTAIEAIQIIKPDVFLKGSKEREQNSHTSNLALEKEQVEKIGGKFQFFEDIYFSSSALINRYLPVFPKNVSDFLLDFSSRYKISEIQNYLDEIRTLKVLLIGEVIIDEYHYCNTLGKSGKEPILAAQYVSEEKFAGGILAVGNNISPFCNNVDLLTIIGENDSQEDFICQKLNPLIQKQFIKIDNFSTIIKRRFLESYPLQKLFEIYFMPDEIHNSMTSELFCARLDEIVSDYDVVIVTDYGHGLLSPDAINILCEKSRFLAINTQANAANQGYNTVSKYPRADYVCVSEKEIRLDARNQQHGNLQNIIRNASNNLNCEMVMITRGARGCTCFHKENGFIEIPAFTSNVVDRIGAGDAVLSITAPCAAIGVPMEVIGFIGNAVGSQAVSNVGHRESITAKNLSGYLESLMK
jgi:rfaE bifunctional protein kinase chain/domain/rfaE bifunctional protein nucleotidyltransferase chain/domain